MFNIFIELTDLYGIKFTLNKKYIGIIHDLENCTYIETELNKPNDFLKVKENYKQVIELLKK